MPSGINVGEAFVTIRPETKGFTSDLDNKVSPAIGGLGKVISGVAIAGAALGAGRFLAGTITEFAESARVGRLTEAVIKSTGAAAGLSAKQFGDLANSLAAKTGVDDETIQSSENVLATFTNVQNKVGEGNDIFSRATGLALDMSQALGTDLQGANIQLGKALNDPIKGITALSRVGVSFTQQQKDQIKTLVESGDTLGAQKVILQELSKEFGGAAEAAADPISKLKVILGNAKETIGGALFPIVEQIAPLIGGAVTSIAPVLADGLGKIVPLIGPIVQSLIPVFATIFDTIGKVATKVGPVLSDVFGQLGGTFQKVFAAIGPLIPKLAESFASMGSSVVTDLLPLAPVLAQVAIAGAKIIAAIPPALLTKIVEAFILFAGVKKALGPLDQIAGIAAKAITPIKTLQSTLGPLSIGFKALGLAISANPIGAIVLGIVLLGTALVLAYQHFKPFRDIVDAVGRFLAGVFQAALDGVVTAFHAVVDAVSSAFSSLSGIGDLVGTVIGFFLGIPGAILGALGDLGGLLLGVGQTIIQGLITGVTIYLQVLYAIWIGLPLKILGFLVGAAGWLLGVGGDIIRGLLNGINSVVGTLWGFFSGLPGQLLNLIGDIAGKFLGIGGDIVRGIKQGISDAWNGLVHWIEGKLGDVLSTITDFFDIGSPSKLMARKVGAPIVQGIAVGMAGEWAPLVAGFKQQAAALTSTTFAPGVSLSGTSALSLGATGTQAAGRGSGPITINQTFMGSVNRDDLEQSNDALISALTDVFRTVN